uniref:Uncharacterized protein n=1 Tax=mine drainage metagenome TaxID=410659 RepID=E6QUA7_9ZZZZ
MSSPHIDKPRNIPANAGDIFVTQTKSCGSFLIRAVTISKWSHVGIAIDKDFVLEAVKDRDGSADITTQVRVVPIAVFAANSTAMRQYKRPENLPSSQIEKLNSFAALNQDTGYTAIHAAFTALIPIMRFFFIIVAIASMFYIWPKAGLAEALTLSFIFSAFIINVIIFVLYRLLTWSFRSNWGVKATENFFRKCRVGNWLVEIKYEMFCSRLVLLADRMIGGPLAKYLPNEDEIQPKHFAEACQKLGWETVDV